MVIQRLHWPFNLEKLIPGFKNGISSGSSTHRALRIKNPNVWKTTIKITCILSIVNCYPFMSLFNILTIHLFLFPEKNVWKTTIKITCIHLFVYLWTGYPFMPLFNNPFVSYFRKRNLVSKSWCNLRSHWLLSVDVYLQT